MQLFNFAADQARTPAPSWAKRAGKVLAPLFSESGTQPLPGSPDAQSLTNTFAFESNPFNISSMWKTFNSRKAVYRDIMRMDEEDEIIATALDIIADCACDFNQEESEGQEQITFRVKAKDPKVQKEIDDLIRRCGLYQELWQIVREFVKHGNYLPEVVLDTSNNNIVRLKPTIQYQIFYRSTSRGDRLPGWISMEEKDVYNVQSGQDLEDWQICPFCFGAKHGFLATSILEAVRRNWIRLSLIEDSMGIARLTRAYDKHVHKIPIDKDMDAAQIQGIIKRYKDTMTKRKMLTSEGEVTNNDNPIQVNTDFFLPDDGTNRGGVEVLNATNLQLGNLNDIYYHRERIICRLRVPQAWLQITSSMKTHLKAGSGVGSDLQFAVLMRRVIGTAKLGLCRLIDLQLKLKGIDPTNAYTVEMTKIESKDPMENAKVLLTMGQAAVYFVEAFGALPAEVISAVFFNLTPDQQKLIDSFLKKEGNEIMAARIAAIKLEAVPPPTPPAPVYKSGPKKASGSGNNNKSKASRSSEQKGGPKQSIDVEALAETFDAFQQGIVQYYQEEGIDIPDMDTLTQAQLRDKLIERFVEDSEDE